MHCKRRCRGEVCGLDFTDTPPPGKPLAMEVTAVLLYVSGLSMNRTGKLLGVSTPTIQAWIEQFAELYEQKSAPAARAVAVELDELWHDLKKGVEPAVDLEGLGSCFGAVGGLGMRRSLRGYRQMPDRAAEALANTALLCPRPCRPPSAFADRAAPCRQAPDPRHRARQRQAAALARTVPPSFDRCLQGRADGRRQHRSVCLLRRQRQR